MAKIGVFDSGVGGLSVANAIQRALPESTVMLREDKENLPYGDKTSEQLLLLVEPILNQMVGEGCEVVVIACNTVTTTIITELRKRFSIPLVGMEPMVKSATELSSTYVIAVFATPTTLKSARYKWLKQEYARGIKVVEPDCSTWSAMIEHNRINENLIHAVVDEVLSAHADIIVLGCTHYHWIEDMIQQFAGTRATVLQPELPVIRQLKRVLELPS